MPSPPSQLSSLARSTGKTLRYSAAFGVILLACLAPTGCNRLKPKPQSEIVYVLAKDTFLRDRVAAVSNRVAQVQNGQRLEVIERGRRFLRVKTEKGEIGWIEEHAVVNPEVVTGFESLNKAHEHDPVVATAVLRDDGYLHLKPGRDTDRFYLLPEGDKLQLLVRASVPKAVGPQASGTASSYAGKPPSATGKKPGKAAHEPVAAKRPEENRPPTPPPPAAADTSIAGATTQPSPPGAANGAAGASPSNEPPLPVPMEDWWMVRDSQGKVGWVMSRRMDIDVPDEVAQYAEGQRMVGAYLLRKVDDPESSFPDKQAPEYVTVLNTYQDGLPYDFNQVRVFTWNLKKHRYETAFRQRNLQGYLPVVVASETVDKEGTVPTFQIKQGVGDSVTIDPETGSVRPTSISTNTYRLEGELVKKDGPPPSGLPTAQPAAPANAGNTPGKGKKKAARQRHRHRD
jgi:SH3-like domain-containing protein